MTSVCVFCGSKRGNENSFTNLARELGSRLASENCKLIYGGAQIGLMGAVADAALDNGGKVVGVIPVALSEREVTHPGLTDLIVTADMHERKKEMYSLADIFVALPGGIGTLEEVFEAAPWTKLGMHEENRYKPVILLGGDGFWEPLTNFLDLLVDHGYLQPANREIISSASSVEEVITQIKFYNAGYKTPSEK